MPFIKIINVLSETMILDDTSLIAADSDSEFELEKSGYATQPQYRRRFQLMIEMQQEDY